MPNVLTSLHDLDQLEGLISPEVGAVLASHASAVLAKYGIVEIGSYKGKSTAYLAYGATRGFGARVYAVDPWDLPGNAGGRFGFDQRETRHAFHRQIASVGLASAIMAQQGFSTQIAKQWGIPIGLLYIDGSHTERDVRADWLAWSPHLAPGATVIFDDYDTKPNPGVKIVVDEIRRRDRRAWSFETRPLAIGVTP